MKKERIKRDIELVKKQITKETLTHDCTVEHCDVEKVAMLLVGIMDDIEELKS